MRHLWRCTAFLLLAATFASPATAVEGGYRQAILVQNSGWMEPFFHDPASPMKPLIGALGDQLAVGGHVAIASFNQDGHIAGRRSPHVVYRGALTAGTVRQAMGQIDLPRRPDGHFADADFQGALTGAITDMLGGQPGVIWMVTNNKNAPGNDPRVQENTRAYFQQLGNSNAISRLVAFPLRMPVRGRSYAENGLIIYGIGYGEAGGEMLRTLVERINGSGLFADPAVVLKPLDEVPLRFVPARIHPENLQVRWQDAALIVEGLSGGAQEILIEGSLQSDFYPHVIEQAGLRASWRGLSRAGDAPTQVDAAVSPARLDRLQPLAGGVTVTVRLRVPEISRPPGLAGLRQERVDVVGMLVLALDDVGLTLGDEFVGKMQALYGLDQLPSLFFDNRRVRSGSAVIPVRLTTQFSIMPLVILVAAVGFTLVATAGLLVLLKLPRTDTVRVGGVVRKVTLSPFQTQELSDPATGTRVKVRMGLAGKASVINLNKEDGE